MKSQSVLIYLIFIALISSICSSKLFTHNNVKQLKYLENTQIENDLSFLQQDILLPPSKIKANLRKGEDNRVAFTLDFDSEM